ncbi:class I SAM-dependent methyltransferase [Anaerocolumna jejuensis]|uniref:class I SAM-dependent methyltransferase n=1 Tax=Anaerocolumna jejuensis TaxID=259063 RepID=UPI003F7BD4AE
MYQRILDYLKEKPALYAPGTAPFWNDSHISKGMLEAHLAPEVDGASRKHGFIKESADWISDSFAPNSDRALLDLGCGPGIYAQLFSKAGFSVTGIDFSERSVEYASQQAAAAGLPIHYRCGNYLEIHEKDAFDVVTLIYCDFGVLAPADRKSLLLKIRKALKNGGTLILDAWTKGYLKNFSEGRNVDYCDNGFWSENPYMCIQSNYLYPDTGNYPDTANYLEQFIVVTEDACQCYNNWNQIYTMQSLKEELAEAGFSSIVFYDNVAGKPYTGLGDTICAAAKKSQ